MDFMNLDLFRMDTRQRIFPDPIFTIAYGMQTMSIILKHS